MKKLFYLLAIIPIVAFTSCDNKPDDLPTSLSATAEKSANIVATKGDITSKEIVFELKDFEGLEKYSKWVKRGTVQTTSDLKIENLPISNEIKLSNVSLSLASNSKTKVDLPDITGGHTFDEVKYLNFMQNVLNEVVGKGTSKVRLNYKAETDITNPAKFSIKIDSRFEF